MTKIGLVTTLDTNIGDDLIRLGIQNVIRSFGDKGAIDYIPINKHKPWTVFRAPLQRGLLKLTCQAPRGRYSLQTLVDRNTARFASSYFDECDFIIQCGAPVFWMECHKSEWATALWRGVLERLAPRIPILNLAAGSAFPWGQREKPRLSDGDRDFIRHITGLCRATAVRDRLAVRLCSSLGLDVNLIPCSAFLSAATVERRPPTSGPLSLLVNYMQGGGHYSWDEEPVDSAKWEETMKKLLARVGDRYRISFLCHNLAEEKLAQRLWPGREIIKPRSAEEYHRCIAGADIALCNRMHASVALASIGVPSVAIGTDTRLLMVGELGLPVHFVNDATADLLEHQLHHLASGREAERERLMALKASTLAQYRELLTKVGVTEYFTEQRLESSGRLAVSSPN
ncbi:MAG TPA: polysaccharide pyruvyl transferase family protein [Bryobacteraceae bacterium]|nr:polysaccharide pyruvyl transferase family protein [Bryobacteraceae bacterium]HTF66566.1 polysaccharide pyruvyl transferase family protein [Edaphobacter sp.]